MSDWERTAIFTNEDEFQSEGTAKLELQDTADIFTYSVDGVRQWTMGVSEMTALFNMIHDMPYPNCPDEDEPQWYQKG